MPEIIESSLWSYGNTANQILMKVALHKWGDFDKPIIFNLQDFLGQLNKIRACKMPIYDSPSGKKKDK